MRDMFRSTISVGDEIYFPTTGEMDLGIVHKIGNKTKILVKNSSGYTKTKDPKFCVLKKRTHNALLNTHPEQFI